MKLSVTVSVDLDLSSVTIRPAGLLSTENVQALLAVINRASRTLPDLSVRLDLEHLHATSEDALQVLRQSAAETTPGRVLAFDPSPRTFAPRIAA